MNGNVEQVMGHPPIACNLQEAAQAARRDELSRELFAGYEGISELPDGYEFRFPGSAEWAAALTRFVMEERECCPFFTFELRFEPDRGPITLRLRGSEEVKEFVRAAFVEPARR